MGAYGAQATESKGEAEEGNPDDYGQNLSVTGFPEDFQGGWGVFWFAWFRRVSMDVCFHPFRDVPWLYGRIMW